MPIAVAPAAVLAALAALPGAPHALAAAAALAVVAGCGALFWLDRRGRDHRRFRMDARTHLELPAGLDWERIARLTEEVAGIGVWIVDLERNRLHWSDQVFRIHGYEPGEIRPDVSGAIDFYHPDDRAEVDRLVAEAIAARRDFTFTLRLLRRDGAVRWVESHGRCMVDAAGEVVAVFGVFRDVTEQKARIEAIEEARQRLVFATEGAGDGVWEWLPRQRRLLLSPTASRMLGYEPEDAPREQEFWQQRVHRDDAGRLAETLRRVCHGPSGGNVIDLECRVRCADGSWRWLRCRGMVVERSRSGRATRVFGTFHATDAQHEAMERLAVALQRTEQARAELERFAYVASHDLQGPLRTMASYAQLVDRRYGEALGQEGRELLAFVQDGAARMQALIRDLLAWSRCGSAPMQPRQVALDDVVDAALRDLDAMVQASGARIRREPLPAVTGDETMLR